LFGSVAALSWSVHHQSHFSSPELAIWILTHCEAYTILILLPVEFVWERLSV